MGTDGPVEDGFNEQIFGADEQAPKVAAGLVQKMHLDQGTP
jgi:hypothetical protein